MFNSFVQAKAKKADNSLIELIKNNKSNDLIEAHLKSLQQKPQELKVQLQSVDTNDGQNPLHIAIAKDNTMLVKILLSFGAPIEGAEKFAINQEKMEIAALIRTRAHWRENVQLIEIHFERTIHLIETRFDAENIGEEGICVFGTTGHGKTTLVNYLLGRNYQIGGNPSNSWVVLGKDMDLSDTPRKIGKIGNGIISETEVPQAWDFKEIKKNVLIDMPGIEDVRGKEIEIAAAVCRQHIIKKLSRIRCIIFVCDIHSIRQSPPTVYFRAAEKIGHIIKYNKQINIIFVVTKTEQELSKAKAIEIEREVREKLIRIKDGICQANKDEKTQAILATTEAILEGPTNALHIANITSSVSRTSLFQTISSFNSEIKDKFDFAADKDLKTFMLCMEKIVEKYNSIKKFISTNRVISEDLNDFLNKLNNFSSGDILDGFALHLLDNLPSITDKYLNSYILLVEKVEDNGSILYKKVKDNPLSLYYVRNKNSLEPINISNQKDFKNFLNQLSVAKIDRKNNKLILSKPEVNKLITQNSAPTHTPESFDDYLKNFIASLDKKPPTLEYMTYFKYVAITLIVYLELPRITPQIPLRFRIPETYRPLLWKSGATGFGIEQLGLYSWKISKRLFDNFSATATTLAQTISDKEIELKKFATDSIFSLRAKINPLNDALKQAHLDLKVNKDCYNKLAKVLKDLDLNEYPKLSDFVYDVENLLDIFLNSINCCEQKPKVLESVKINAKL